MLIAQIVVLAVIAVSMICAYIILKVKKIKIPDLAYKIVSGVLALIFFFRFMLGYDAISEIFALTNSPIDNSFLTVISLILNWFLYAVVLLVVLYPFFKNSKYATVIKYFGFIVTILCTGFIYYLTIGIVGTDAYNEFSARTLLIGLELGILLAYCFVVFMENGKFKVSKNDAWGFAYIIGMLLATMPSYMLGALFGNLNYAIPVDELSQPHRIILYLAFIIPFVLYVLLRKKDSETVRGILLYISLGTLLTFSINYRFADFLDVTHWPINLCNTAMYIIPICLIFKWNKLFYFTYFINVLGALFAMMMPNYDETLNLFSDRIVSFYVNHFIAFFMPILMVALKVYKRPRLREFKYSMIGFLIYFVIVLIFNAWFSNYGEVDYFFHNSYYIPEKLGSWAVNLMNIQLAFSIGGLDFVFYPVYQILFFLVYVLLGAAVWFVYEGAYSFADTVNDIIERKRKIKMDQLALEIQLAGRKMEEPMNLDGINKVVLRNFTKRYGRSNVYAVKDVNLEVHGGEIFGFLGHNGAGKSTIIKSMVGIQPISSGNIEICGYDMDKQSVMAKQNIGYVPDHYALYEKLTGREYISYIADLYHVSPEQRNLAVAKYVSLFELNDAFDNQIKTYSHGMKQKIAIMSALVHNPKVWILDEPLTGLDPISIFQVKECMRQHAKEGNIVIFSSHLIDIVESLCDKIAIIKRGRILSTADVKDVLSKQSLEDYYLEVTKTPVDYFYVEKETLKKEQEQINSKRTRDKKRRKDKIDGEENQKIGEEKEDTSQIDLIVENKKEKFETASKHENFDLKENTIKKKKKKLKRKK